MSNPTSTTKAASLARVQALIAGTQQHLPNGSFTLGNATLTSASLVQLLQSLVDAMQKQSATAAAAKDGLAALAATEAHVNPVMRDFRRFLVLAYAPATQTLADFGLPAPKARKPLTTEARAAATAKLRATRAARGTTSKKQKLAVKGDVTGVVVTPVTASAHPAPTQPASNTSGAPTAAPPK